jgi:hypothetical protein
MAMRGQLDTSAGSLTSARESEGAKWANCSLRFGRSKRVRLFASLFHLWPSRTLDALAAFREGASAVVRYHEWRVLTFNLEFLRECMVSTYLHTETLLKTTKPTARLRAE